MDEKVGDLIKAEIQAIKSKETFNIQVPKMDVKIDETKSYSEQAKDFVGALATKNAVEDEKLVADVTEKKKEELKHNASANLKKEEAESKKADIRLQEANYGVFDGVATYAGIKKPLPQKMQKALFGILSVIQTLFLVILGVPTSIINIIADCFDGIVKKLSNITKSARWFVIGILIAAFAYVCYLIVTALLRKYSII